MAVDKRHLIDNERLADYSREVKKTFVKQTVTVAGKPLSADVVLDKLTVSGKFSDITGSQYDGSGVVSIYSPDQNVSVGSTPTFKTVTVTDGITGDVTSAQKVDHSLLVTHSALDIGEKSFDGSATVNIYSPDQNVNDGSSPTFATVTGDIFKGALRGNADTATDFEASKSITLSGDVSGSGSGGNGTGWQLTNMSIGTGKVLNTMLAHSTIGIGNLTMSLGDSTTTLAGMDSITSTSFVGTLTGNSSNVNDIVAILHGGTGASTVAGALANLGLTYTFLYKGEYSGDANLTTIPVGYYHVSGVTTINHFPVDGMYGTFIQYDGGYHTQELIADSDGYTRKVYIRRYDTTTSAWLGWYDVSRGDVYGVKGSNETAYRVGQVSISKADVGLSNADNTADSVKHVLYSDSAGKTTYTLSVVNGASDKGSAGSFNGSSAFTVYTPNQNVNLNSSPTFATLTATSYLGTWDGNVLASVKIPTATASVKGGVVIGTGLGVKSDGTLSVTYGTVSGTAYEGDKGNALAVKLTNVSYASATDTTTVTDPVVLSGTVSMTGSSISMGVTPKVNGVAVSLVGHTHVLTDVTDITATASEVNTLHGITSSTAELNVLHGITSSTAELNKLTGLTPTTTELNYVDGVTSSIQTQLDTLDSKKVNVSLLGVANGVATLDSEGTVPASQLPSYVDDILEGYYGDSTHFYKDSAKTEAYTPESGKIYTDISTDTAYSDKTYRWSGTQYSVVSESLALGETSSTAYRGDRGKIAYDHSLIVSGNPHKVTKTEVGLGNADNTADSVKVVLSATGFTTAKTITLTGNVTGSASGGNSTNGWTIATVIPVGMVTNSMLAGSIANAKLANSSFTLGTTLISLGGSTSTLAGLSNITSTLFTGVATQVQTVKSVEDASFYLTFADSNNTTATGESLYTGVANYNPYTDILTTTVSNISGTASVATTSSHVWFSDSATETARASDDDFKYTPSTNVLTVGSISGTASALTTARKIAGVSFNGTADISIPFVNLSSIPTTVAGYGITDAVTLAGNQTIAGTKTFSSTISGSVSGNSGTATALQTARKIAGVSFNGTADIAIPFANLSSIPTTVNGYGITDAVTLAGDQTIAGVKTFSSTITGSVSGNSGTATALQTARTIAGVSFNGTANIAIPFANLSSIPTTVSGYGITDAITTHGGQTIAGTLTVSDTLSTHALLPVDNGLSDIGSVSKLYDGIYANTGDFTNSITVPTVNGNLNGVALHVASTYGVLTISTTALAEDATFNGAEGNNVSVYSPAQLVNPTSNVTFNLVTASTVTANLTGNATSADKVNHTLTITTTPTILSSTFNGSANATVYTPDQSVNSGSSPTFDAITGTSFSGNSATATKVNHTLTTVRIPTTIASYDGSEAQTIYSPGQGLETTDTVTFAGITSEVIVGKVTGNADSASKVLHPLVMTTNTVTGADTFDGSVSKSVYTPDQSVNNGASPTFTTVTANLTGTASNASKVTNALTFTTSGPTATGTYNGSAVKSVYSPDQSVNIGDNVTFGTVTAKLTGDVTGNASTATTLQTARTINGTSFDGSVNITTSSWGTSRTLYVKDSASQYTGSGVSVNGGADATLVLPSIIYAESFTGNKNRFNHDLAYYGGSSRNVTGAIVITLPNAWNNTMASYEIGVYQYDAVGGSRIVVSGYNYSETSAWMNTRTLVEGSYTNGVRVGYTGSKCCIILGDITTVWQYPQVHLLNVTAGYQNETAWRTGYSISLVTDLSGYSKLVTPDLSDSHAKTVTANTFYGSLSGTAQTTAKVDTVASTSSSTFYPTFVDSNNNATASELVYTSGGVSYVPSTGTLASIVVSSPKVIGTAVQTERVVIKGTVESPTAYMEYDDASSAIVFNVA